MPPHLADLSADLDALYRAPVAEFITQRNTLATRVRAEQGKDAAAAVKALTKPSGTAWVVNQLFWRHAQEFQRLMKAGDHLRDEQQALLAGHEDADVRGVMEARQAALTTLMARVPDLLAEAGLSASAAMRQRVSTTLEALSIYGGREPGPRVGRLTEDVDPPSFAALAALVPPGPRPTLQRASPTGSRTEAITGKTGATPAPSKLRKVDTRRLTDAKTALDRAKTDASRAQFAAKTADTAQRRAETTWQQVKAELDDAQRRLDTAMDRKRAAEARRDEARKAAVTARQAAERAERLRDQAERAYRELLGR